MSPNAYNMTVGQTVMGANNVCGQYTGTLGFQADGLLLIQQGTTDCNTFVVPKQTLTFTVRNATTLAAITPTSGSITVADISSQSVTVNPAGWRRYWDLVTFSTSATRTGGTNTNALNATSGTQFYVTNNNTGSASTKWTDIFSFTTFPGTFTYEGRNGNRWRPLSYISSSGYSSLPKVGFTPGVNAAAANYCLTDTQANWTTQCLRCNTWSYDSTLRVCTTQNCTGTNCA